MMKSIVLLCLILICTCSCVTDWNKRDKWLLAGSTVAMGADVYTTNRAIKRGYHEAGLPQVFIGEKPSTGKIIAFGGGSQVVLYFLSDWFPGLRPWLLGMTGGAHAGAAVYNYIEVD